MWPEAQLLLLQTRAFSYTATSHSKRDFAQDCYAVIILLLTMVLQVAATWSFFLRCDTG